MADRTCSIDGCPKDVRARGWCVMHWKRWSAHGDPLYVRPQPRCAVEGCESDAKARGWCGLHWKRWRAHGDPLYVPVSREEVPCTIDGCERPAKARSWCAMHNSRWERRGDTGAPEQERVRAYMGQECSVEGCGNPAEKLGMCPKHWVRQRTHGNTETVLPFRRPPRDPGATCSVNGCGRSMYARTWCQAHYQRWLTHGDALYVRVVEISECMTTGCDKIAYCRGLCITHHNRWRRQNNPQYFRDASKRRRALKLMVPAELFTTAEIFERDGWICGVCTKPVDRALKWPDRQSPSLDHIVPLTRGGHHVRANVQLAHLVCNMRKGASLELRRDAVQGGG